MRNLHWLCAVVSPILADKVLKSKSSNFHLVWGWWVVLVSIPLSYHHTQPAESSLTVVEGRNQSRIEQRPLVNAQYTHSAVYKRARKPQWPRKALSQLFRTKTRWWVTNKVACPWTCRLIRQVPAVDCTLTATGTIFMNYKRPVFAQELARLHEPPMCPPMSATCRTTSTSL